VPEAARVLERELAEGTEVTASACVMTGDGWEAEYRIVERISSKVAMPAASDKRDACE
jgi:hypothetical protein